MVDILLILRPRWSRKVLAGEKTIELRKSAPHGASVFHVYVYETKANHGRGAVVGECICYLAQKIERFYEVAEGSCVPVPDIITYAKGKALYGWYLAKVITYEQPRTLSDFGMVRAPQSWCYVKRVA